MDAEIGIIGLGTMGSMAAWQLAKKGVSVIGFEQFGVGHDLSAAGGESRLFRSIYKEGLEYVPLIKQSYDLWRELENNSGRELFKNTSGLIIGNLKIKSMQDALRSIEKYDLDFEILNEKEANLRYPQHHLQVDESIIVDGLAGYLRPQSAIISGVELAEKLGAAIHTHSKVNNIIQSNEGVYIRTNDKEYKVKKVLITAGPWSINFLKGINNSLGVRRLINCWFVPRNYDDYTEYNFLPFTRDKGNLSYYGFPAIDSQMVKIGIFSTEKEEIESPDFLKKNISIEELEPFIEIIKEDIPGLHQFPSRVGAYMEIFTEDMHPLIGKLHEDESIYYLTGFSGHGFKMAPAYGKIAADIVLGTHLKHSLSKFSPTRFL